MRIFILLLFTLIFNVCLYAQDTNVDNTIATNNNTISTNNVGESAIMQINRFDARRNPVSFINLVNFTPYYVLREYARVNNIEIYPYDTESTLRARIIERQVNIKQEVITDKDQIREVARNTINRGIEILRNVGINTVGVACIATLGKKVAENLEDKNIEVANLTNYRNILKEACANAQLPN